MAVPVRNPPAYAGDARDKDSTAGSERCPGGGNSSPLQDSCLENPRNRGAWQATVYGVAIVEHDLATKPPPSSEIPKKFLL